MLYADPTSGGLSAQEAEAKCLFANHAESGVSKIIWSRAARIATLLGHSCGFDNKQAVQAGGSRMYTGVRDARTIQSEIFTKSIAPLSHEQKQEEQALGLYVAAPRDDKTRYQFRIPLGDTPIDFIYCLSGKAIISLSVNNGVTTEIGKDECIAACLPGTKGEMHICKRPFRAVLLRVSQGFLGKWFCGKSRPLFHGHLLFPRENLTPYMERMALPFAIARLLQQIILWREAGPIADAYMTAKKYELLYKQMQLHGGAPSPRVFLASSETLAASKVYQDLLQNIAAPPCLAKLAASVGLNRGKLTAIFRQAYGDTVFGVLRRERLKQACSLLEGDRDKNITEIAYLCGFSSPGHLTKSFVAQFGMTPKLFRRRKENRLYGAQDDGPEYPAK